MTPLGPGTSGTIDPSRWHHGPAWITVGACAVAVVPAGLRWLRVAQREHYLPGSATRFAVRWWRIRPWNPPMLAVAVGAAAVSLWWPIAGVATALVVAAGPVGLSLRGRTSALAWTRRLRTLAVVWLALDVAAVVIGVAAGPACLIAVVAVVAVPLGVDLACVLTAPLEHRLSRRFVDRAAARLARVAPTVVAITGSYGKTSTKGHVAHLVRPTRTVVATPASFNNRAGLARAVNEHLAEGTEVFVAEMGTYGPGEIADLCRWCPPDIAVITAIGPVHLERFGSEDRIVEAKSEILVAAHDVVLPVDDPRLAELADRAQSQGKRVHRCSVADRAADVCVLRSDDGSRISVFAQGATVVEGVEVPTGVQPSNLACAVSVALALGVDRSVVASRLADLPSVDHRLQAARAPSGVTVLDDTYNANPAGATEALAALGAIAGPAGPAGPAPPDAPGAEPRRQVVVTPGMVELGRRQFDENQRLGSAIAGQADHLVVVGMTNRRALRAGVARAAASGIGVTEVRHRVEAVAWVRTHLQAGDVVLYENDLPDHYP